MRALRALIRRTPALAALVFAAALAVKLLVPAGFMPVVSAGGITLAICDGAGPATLAPMAHAMPPHDGHHGKSQHDHAGKADGACPYAGLTLAGMPGADPIQLTIALTFVLATGLLLATTPVIAAPRFLRPPLRGPPVRA